jgi:Lysyl oxidase
MQLSARARVAALALAGCVVLASVVGTGSAEPEQSSLTAMDAATTASQAASDRAQDYPDPRPIPASARLLPNLKSLPPEDVELRIADGQRQLWFTSIIANAGIGPAEVVPDELLPCPPGQHHASQVLYHDVAGNGRFDRAVDLRTTLRQGGCMLDHPTHGHWHFDAMARYALTRPGELSPLVASDKVSFCLRDNRPTPSASPAVVPQHYGDCAADTVQGISPGWADVYDTDLPDQHLVLPADLPDGRYCLHNEADPLKLLLETRDEDNAAVVAVLISGNTAAPDPTGTCTPRR